MKTIGRYEVVGEIGRGGFGVVYKARDPLMDRVVAIKLMLKDASEDVAAAEAQLARFQREAKITGNLNHPNLVTIFELGSHEGQPYLVMEFMQGADLAHVIEKRRPLSLLDRLDILVQAATGLARAHEEDVVHRDIKPHNIFLLEDRRVKVMDFGIARMTSTSSQVLTRTGYQLGSFAWMAPEQFDGTADFQTDVWSFGVTAYEFLTGAHPFLAGKAGLTTEEIFSRIVMARYSHPLEVAQTLPAPVAEVVVRTMQKDRAHRYASMDEVRLDLEALLGAERQEQANTLVRQADTYRLEGNADQALALVREALELDKTNPAGHQLRRQLQLEVRNRQTQRQVGNAVQEANQFRAQNQLGAAIEVLERALAVDPDNQSVRQRLAEIESERQRRLHLERSLSEAERALGSQDLPAARTFLQQALGQEPAHEQARMLLSRLEAAEKRLVALQGLTKSFDQIRATLARGEVDAARQQLMAIDQQAGALELPLHLREQRAAVAAELTEAMQAAQTIDAARLALQRQDFRQALSRLESLEGVPQQSVVQTLIGQVRTQLAEWASSFSSNALLPRVKELRAAGQRMEALTELRRAIEINPADDRLRQMAEWIEREIQELDALAAIQQLEQEIQARFVGDVEGSFARIEQAMARYVAIPPAIGKLGELQATLRATLAASAERALREGDLPAQQNLAAALQLATRRFPAAVVLQDLSGQIYRSLEKTRAEQALRLVEQSLQARQLTESEQACAALDAVPGVSTSACSRLGTVAWAASQAVAQMATRGAPEEGAKLAEALRFAQMAVRLRATPVAELSPWIHLLESRQRICSRRMAALGSAERATQSSNARKQYDRDLILYAADTQNDPTELAFFVDIVRRAAAPLQRAGKTAQLKDLLDKASELRPEVGGQFGVEVVQPIAVPATTEPPGRAARPSRMGKLAGVGAVLLLAVAGGGFLFWKSRPTETMTDPPKIEIEIEKKRSRDKTDTDDTPLILGIPKKEGAEVRPPEREIVTTDQAKAALAKVALAKVALAKVEQAEAALAKDDQAKAALAKAESVGTETGQSGSPMMGLGGLRKSEITWGGSLSPGAELTVTGNRASSGNVSVGGLQLRPGRVVVLEPSSGLEIVAGPSPAGWSTVTLRNATGRELRRIRLRWEPQP